ncbi:hypothetical protein MMC29_001864 [Sticta canariensis]|nr:hypothetical protein [Sticta canariensis]
MKTFAAISTVFLALVASSYALPTAEATAEALPAGYEPITRDEILRRLDTSSAASPLEKRTPGGIYLCTGSNYTGTCGYKVQPFNTCINLTAPYLRNIGSFGPDKGALCRLTTIRARVIFGTIMESTTVTTSHHSSARNVLLASEEIRRDDIGELGDRLISVIVGLMGWSISVDV